MNEHLEDLLERFRGIPLNARSDAPQDSCTDYDDRQQQLDDLKQNLYASNSFSKSTDRVWRGDDLNPYSFEAVIIHPDLESSRGFATHVQLDTGCKTNWISLETLERASLMSEITELQIRVPYAAFGGHIFEPLGTIEVTWYPTKTGKSRKTIFLVQQEVPYDLVLGWKWISEESMFVFEDPALALRMGKFTKGKSRASVLNWIPY